MSNIIIRAENLGKSYIIGHEATAGKRERYTALRDVIARKFHNIASKTKQVIGRTA
jgi:lipopolysaccharide transport system ATP-binding protein